MKFDAIIIGAGQAGVPLSRRLADQRWSVAFIEKDKLGGTCVNTGRTPTKTLVARAQVSHLGRVGLTEKEARAKGHKSKIGKLPMTNAARAIERDETAGLMKIVVDAANDRILGASILSSEGGEIVQLLGVAIMANAPFTLLKGAVYIHPTLAEGFWSLLEEVKPVD